MSRSPVPAQTKWLPDFMLRHGAPEIVWHEGMAALVFQAGQDSQIAPRTAVIGRARHSDVASVTHATPEPSTLARRWM